jgi:hypothetical protein
LQNSFVESLDMGNGVFVHTTTDTGCYLSQGACSYPINRSNLTGKTMSVFRSGFFVEAPIGSVNVTASREHLEYDSFTTKFLDTLADKIEKEFSKDVIAKFKNIETRYEAVLLAYNESKSHAKFDLIKNVNVWGNKTLSDLSVSNKISLDFVKKISVTMPDGTSEDRNVCMVDIKFLDKHRRKSLRRFNLIKHRYPNIDFRFYPNTQNIIVLGTGQIRNINPILEHNYGNVEFENLFYIKIDPLYEKDVRELLEKNLKGSGDNTIIVDFDSLEVPPKEISPLTKKPRVKKRILLCNPNKQTWEEAEKDVETGGIYVNVSVYTPEKFSSYSQFRKFVTSLRELDLLHDNENVYGVQASFKSIPEKNKKWVSLYKIVEKRIESKLKNKNTDALLKENKEIKFCNRFNSEIDSLKFFKDYSKQIEDAVDNYFHYTGKKPSNVSHLLNILQVVKGCVSISVDNTEELCESQKKILEVYKTYPLLDLAGNRPSEKRQRDFIEYIQLINIKQKVKANAKSSNSSNTD